MLIIDLFTCSLPRREYIGQEPILDCHSATSELLNMSQQDITCMRMRRDELELLYTHLHTIHEMSLAVTGDKKQKEACMQDYADWVNSMEFQNITYEHFAHVLFPNLKLSYDILTKKHNLCEAMWLKVQTLYNERHRQSDAAYLIVTKQDLYNLSIDEVCELNTYSDTPYAELYDLMTRKKYSDEQQTKINALYVDCQKQYEDYTKKYDQALAIYNEHFALCKEYAALYYQTKRLRASVDERLSHKHKPKTPWHGAISKLLSKK